MQPFSCKIQFAAILARSRMGKNNSKWIDRTPLCFQATIVQQMDGKPQTVEMLVLKTVQFRIGR